MVTWAPAFEISAMVIVCLPIALKKANSKRKKRCPLIRFASCLREREAGALDPLSLGSLAPVLEISSVSNKFLLELRLMQQKSSALTISLLLALVAATLDLGANGSVRSQASAPTLEGWFGTSSALGGWFQPIGVLG